MHGQVRPSLAPLYLGAIILAGGAALASSLYELVKDPIPHEWMLLAALTLLSFFLAIKVPGIPAKISVSETFVFATVLLFGTHAATVTVALDGLIMSGWRHRREPAKILFNATEPALSIWIASQLFFSIVGVPLRNKPLDGTALLFPVLALSLTYFVLNSLLTTVAIALESGSRILPVLRGHFLWLALNYLGGASIAVLIVQNSTTVNVTTISIILPVLIITYLTFKSSMGRIEDANRHVAQLNRLYMSSIETLAMAVDAKDQTTHGHIRRVQTHAVSLARTMGLDDVELIRAIEAAALLHDIGKLAIPDHILNKPGKLNAAEFERMKTHAALGSEILSSAHFPYPVVPIVRHHHENWDGTGYPDGLAGVDIPIGARLLAVVDCFDALTSDRPYRPRMSRKEALDVLQRRRGTMYDPLVVDTFARCINDIAPQEANDTISDAELRVSTYDRKSIPQLLFGEGGDVSLSPSREEAVDYTLKAIAADIQRELDRHVPNAVFAVYRIEPVNNYLRATQMSAELRTSIEGLRIPIGRQLSGWVAAHKQTVVNADPQLDFIEGCTVPLLRHAVCTPIVCGTVLFGVLAVYRRSDVFFAVDETQYIESLSRMVASLLATRISDQRDAFIAGKATYAR